MSDSNEKLKEYHPQIESKENGEFQNQTGNNTGLGSEQSNLDSFGEEESETFSSHPSKDANNPWNKGQFQQQPQRIDGLPVESQSENSTSQNLWSTSANFEGKPSGEQEEIQTSHQIGFGGENTGNHSMFDFFDTNVANVDDQENGFGFGFGSNKEPQEISEDFDFGSDNDAEREEWWHEEKELENQLNKENSKFTSSSKLNFDGKNEGFVIHQEIKEFNQKFANLFNSVHISGAPDSVFMTDTSMKFGFSMTGDTVPMNGVNITQNNYQKMQDLLIDKEGKENEKIIEFNKQLKGMAKKFQDFFG